MGDRIPVILGGELFNKYEKENYVIKLPVRTDEGRLQFKNALIAKSKDAVYGYLPYTRENIIKEAFKLQGDRYDWGNKYNGRDCSSFIANIYKTFGFLLPRNADEQEMSIGKQYKFLSTDTIETRNKILDNVKPGAAIFKPGHVMMYLGKADGVHYMIHDFTSYGKKQGNQYVSTPVFSVGVTSTTLTLSTGDPYIQTFTSALQMEN
jgi:cell wall-associated NlpC family hydrolase